jgi:hypothetical protein
MSEVLGLASLAEEFFGCFGAFKIKRYLLGAGDAVILSTIEAVI